LGSVESIDIRIHPILRVCQQIKAEATSYFYRHNVFRAVNRYHPRNHASVDIAYQLYESLIIEPRYLSLFRNLIIECPRENWGPEWYDKTSSALEKLVEAKTSLMSLTLIVAPQRVGISDTALGLEKRPVTFADFFWLKGRLMKAFLKLKCKRFNVVVKKMREVNVPGITLRQPDRELLPKAVLEKGAEFKHVSDLEADVEIDDKLEEGDTILLDPASAILCSRFVFTIDNTYLSRGITKEDTLVNEITVCVS
jgi:hypothetical protein